MAIIGYSSLGEGVRSRSSGAQSCLVTRENNVVPTCSILSIRSVISKCFALWVATSLGCSGTVDQPGPCDLTFDILNHLRIDEVIFPTPALVGTQFVIRGESFVDQESCVAHEVTLIPDSDDGALDQYRLDSERASTNEIVATLSEDAASGLVEVGAFNGRLIVRYFAVDGDRGFQDEESIAFEVTETLTPTLTTIEQAEAYLHDSVIIDGADFLTGDEGNTEVIVEGTFTLGTDSVSTSVRLSASPVEAQDRSRTAFLWSPAIGGLEPGTFEGTISARNVHASGEETVGNAVDTEMDQRQSTLLRVHPEEVCLGQFLNIEGRGFIGLEDSETTVIRLEGDFTPFGGEAEATTVELVGNWVSGSLVQYPMIYTSEGERLESVAFHTHRGQFDGLATPVLTMGEELIEGNGTEVRFDLGPVRQVVWVRFLTGFRDSLEYYGLGAVEEILTNAIIERMQEIYCPPDEPESCANVQFVADEPADFYEGGFATLELGGADPNNMGLFGYDNTGTKDVGNLRLHDHVGGENALGDIDGFAYGGVFVDSLLYWSSHPPFDDRPAEAPEPDPRFDEIFDPLREREVIAGEYPGTAEGERLEQIETAIHFLSSVIADTGAHEFAHSLGLAQPHGPADALHNDSPGDRCLMDEGVDRPIEERGRLDSNPGARFCDENLTYLLEILPTR